MNFRISLYGAFALSLLLGGCVTDGTAAPKTSIPMGSGIASFYGRAEHGGPTASGERFDMHAATAAHKTAPLGSILEVTNLRNGKSANVRINDRGPFVKGRVIDVSDAVAHDLGFHAAGLTMVELRMIEPGGNAIKRRRKT